MSEIMEEDQSGGLRGKFSLLALVLSLIGVVWFAAAALGSKYGLWGWQFGLGKMTIGWGPIVAFGTLGLSVLAIVAALVKAPRKRPFMLALGALLVSGLLTGRMAALGINGSLVPPIHDVQTNWGDAVVLSDALMAARGTESNPVRYGEEAVFGPVERPEWQSYVGLSIADIQEAAECASHDEDICEDSETPKPYAPLEPLLINAPRAAVFVEAEKIAKARGWSIVTSDAAGGVIEATHTSPWWGFKDDVAIRIREAEGNTTRVDMRSISRVGASDLGANARRIAAFLYELDGQRYDRHIG
ncbi:MAG: DUF1499 domain-containing protein [Hyphomonadaceae bacterium]